MLKSEIQFLGLEEPELEARSCSNYRPKIWVQSTAVVVTFLLL